MERLYIEQSCRACALCSMQPPEIIKIKGTKRTNITFFAMTQNSFLMGKLLFSTGNTRKYFNRYTLGLPNGTLCLL